MAKSQVQEQFAYLVSKVLWPEFKQRGYTKTGNNFRHYDPAGWGKIVNVQKSFRCARGNITFTMNTGLYLREAELDPRMWLADSSKFLEPDCLVRKRVGRLNETPSDLWYKLTDQTVISELREQVLHDVTARILPYLDAIHSADDILRQITREKDGEVLPSIRALFICGYQQEARKWIAEELAVTIYKPRKKELLNLRNELEAMS